MKEVLLAREKPTSTIQRLGVQASVSGLAKRAGLGSCHGAQE